MMGTFARISRSLYLLLVLPLLLLLSLLQPACLAERGAAVAAGPARPGAAAAAAAPAAAFVPGAFEGRLGLRPRAPWPVVRASAKRDKKASGSRRRPSAGKGPGGGTNGEAGSGGGAGSEDDPLDGGGFGDAAAPRVSSQINIPVRRQIAFAKQMKKLMKQDDRPASPPPKKARKKKAEAQKAAIPSDYAAFDPSLCTTYLLVDGYNVINNWSKMIKARSVGGMPTARAALLEQLRYISQARRWKVVVAYDEHTPGSELRVMEGDVDEVFTGEMESADSYIERRAHELCSSRTPPTVKVATDDRTIQVVSLASGAEMMSTSSLIKEIYVARRELLHQMDGGAGWASSRRFDDASEYFDG